MLIKELTSFNLLFSHYLQYSSFSQILIPASAILEEVQMKGFTVVT
jgi:hypothetical protein